MEHFVLVPACLNNENKSLKTQAVRKQELPMFQVNKISRTKMIRSKKISQKKLFGKADTLVVKKVLSCPRIKFSYSQTLLLYGVQNWRITVSDFAH